jgi:hypothetical protein
MDFDKFFSGCQNFLVGVNIRRCEEISVLIRIGGFPSLCELTELHRFRKKGPSCMQFVRYMSIVVISNFDL